MQAPQVPAGATILVTGAAGMLGRAVASRLAELGCGSRLLVRRPAQGRQLPPSAEVIVGDVTDPDALDRALEGVSAVLHLAAATGGSRSDFDATNIEGTRNVVEACARQGACRLVHVSSIGVLDHAGKRTSGSLREDAPVEPWPERRGHYTRTKLAAEALVLEAARDRGLDAVVLRPGQIFGPGCEGVTPNGVVALRGWNLVGDGRSLLPLVFVDDVVDALLLAAFRPDVAGELFHIVDSTPVTQREYLAHWRESSPHVPLRRIPFAMALGAAALVELLSGILRREPPLSRYRVRSLRPLSGFDTGKASRMLGWSPRVGVRAGLSRVFARPAGAT